MLEGNFKNMVHAGIYFITDDIQVRIGMSRNISQRIKQHRSSSSSARLITWLMCDIKELHYEENLAHKHFENYHIRDSFYSMEISTKVLSYVANRTNEKLEIGKSENQKTGKVNTLFGEKLTKDFLPQCDYIPGLTAGYIGTKHTRQGLRPRVKWINGERKYLSEKAHKMYIEFSKDTKSKLEKKGLLINKKKNNDRTLL
tara:strand:- start:2014 stop:2613 length:600 start_codon:yes stop_codon:yes gene_type:complete